jgi:hypothetical protein
MATGRTEIGMNPPVKSLWLTYAWIDNAEHDVEFVAQELTAAGIAVQTDRWNLNAGRRLWEQIAAYISDPSKSDGWAIYATQNSLTSEACKEEYFTALDRALHTRGGDFPVIGIFPDSVTADLIPPGIKTRLYVSTSDPDWTERVAAAVEGRTVDIKRVPVHPYALNIHGLDDDRLAIELRPRAGSWGPFFAAVPLSERETVQLSVGPGPPGRVPFAPVARGVIEGYTNDQRWWFRSISDPITPSQSAYSICRALPSELMFGVLSGVPKYRVAFLDGRVTHFGLTPHDGP